MRKRLRKKLHLAEFTEYGFEVVYQRRGSADDVANDALLDRFLAEAIEANDLMCGGGGGPAEFDFFVVAHGRGSPIERQRNQVERWLARQTDIAAHRVGPLQDAWHGPELASGATKHGRDAA